MNQSEQVRNYADGIKKRSEEAIISNTSVPAREKKNLITTMNKVFDAMTSEDIQEYGKLPKNKKMPTNMSTIIINRLEKDPEKFEKFSEEIDLLLEPEEKKPPINENKFKDVHTQSLADIIKK